MLAARHRARLAMQDSNEDTREVTLTRSLRGAQNVRRRLFADETDSDHHEDRRGMADNQTNEFFEEVRSNLEKAKERWNFDFENETPLPGNYEWIKLDKDGNQVEDTIRSTKETKKIIDPTVNEASSLRAQEISQND